AFFSQCAWSSRISSRWASARSTQSRPVAEARFSTVSPGVRLRRLAARPGEDLLETRQSIGGQLQVERTCAPGELVHRARPDDRRRHGRVVEEPGEPDVGRVGAELAAKRLVRLELRAALLDALLDALARAAPLARLPEGAAEEPPGERAPGDEPEAVRAAGR